MVKFLHRIPVVLIAMGALLVAAGIFSSMVSSPVAALDCGCGGQVQCVTKQMLVYFGGVVCLCGVLVFFGRAFATRTVPGCCRS